MPKKNSDRIKVKIDLMGALKRSGIDKNGEVDIKKGATIESILIDKFNFNRRDLKYLNFIVDEEVKQANYKPKNGEKISVLMQIGGGR